MKINKYAGVVQRLVYQFSKLRIGVRLSSPAPEKRGFALYFFAKKDMRGGGDFRNCREFRVGSFAWRLSCKGPFAKVTVYYEEFFRGEVWYLKENVIKVLTK